MNDLLAPWRNRQQLTLKQAASVCAYWPPSYAWPNHRSDWTTELRGKKAEIAGWLNLFREAVETGDLEVLEHGVVHHSPRPVQKPFTTHWAEDDLPERTYTRKPTDAPEYSVISVEALRVWCESNGYRPEFLFPDDAKPLGTMERENLLQMIGALCELAGIGLEKETKGHAEAKLLKDYFVKRGLRLSLESIARKIAAARSLIAPKGAERIEFKRKAARSNSSRDSSNSNG